VRLRSHCPPPQQGQDRSRSAAWVRGSVCGGLQVVRPAFPRRAAGAGGGTPGRQHQQPPGEPEPAPGERGCAGAEQWQRLGSHARAAPVSGLPGSGSQRGRGAPAGQTPTFRCRGAHGVLTGKGLHSVRVVKTGAALPFTRPFPHEHSANSSSIKSAR